MRLHAPCFVLFACIACVEPVEHRVRSNGTWAPDGSAVLLAETRYETTKSEGLWFYAPDAKNWRTVFLRTDPDLSNPRELATFLELEEGQGGSIQSAKLYWLPGQQRVVAATNHAATAFDLTTGTTYDFTLPDAERTRLFLRGALDLRDTAAPVDVLPSPDETRVAVFHFASYLGSGGFTDLRFVHAVAIHRLDGTFERAIALTAWDDSDEDLNLDLPPPVPALPANDPNGFESWGFVPVHFNTRILWTKDSTGLFVVDVDRPDSGPVTALAWKVNVVDGAHEEVTEVPARAVPTRGGGVSPDGRLLANVYSEGAENDVEVRLHALTDWVAFEDVPLVPATTVDYAR